MGYCLLIAIFLFVSFRIYKENNNLIEIDKETKEISKQRYQTERIIIQLIDLSFLGEQIVGWQQKDAEAYCNKRDSIVYSLEVLKLQLQNPEQCSRIDSILYLLEAKEDHLFAIMQNIWKWRKGYDHIQLRIPEIIHQTNYQTEDLSDRLQENLENRHRQINGIKGLFHNKKKTRELIKQENEIILRDAQKRQSGALHVLADEIATTQKENTLQLISHVDSLSVRNAYLNQQISHLLTEFGITDRRIREDAINRELFGRKKAIITISILSLLAFLLAIVFYILLHKDIQERYNNRIRLERSHRRNAELLAARKKMLLTVSHDLRLPLSAICGYTDLLPDARRKESRQRYCSAIKESAKQMLTLLNTLLDYYRLDTGKEQPDVAPFRVKRLTDTLTAEYAQQAAAKGLEFNVAYEGSNVIAVGDRSRILQIIGNLLSNALKFTERGSVSLRVAYCSDELTISVADTGIGLTDEQQHRIFQPFERLGRADMPEGFGLGLSIVLALVELLHGKIHVHSVLSEGSSFVVTLPLPLYAEERTQQSENEKSNIMLPPDLRIAVVDNDPVLLAMTVEMFSRHAVYADGCCNARELLERIRTVDYDLIVTDIVMTDVTGFGLLELLRTSNIAETRKVPVLAMTARAECDAKEFVKAGFAGCIHKPFSRDDLFAAVRSCIDPRAKQGDVRPDFSVLLNGERNDAEMLCLLVRETETNMAAFSKALHNNNKPTLVALAHHLLSLWELLRIEASLKAFRQLLSDDNTTDETIRAAGESVIATGKRLAEQAAERAKEVQV